MIHNNNLIVLDGSRQHGDMVSDTYHPSGKVLLLFARIQAHKKQSECSLGEIETLFLRKCKDSVMKNNTNHFASTG